ncbi:unnamed protein product [Leuciscus chuanchicus]
MEALRDENADLRKLHRDLIVTVQQLNEERDDLKQVNTKFTSQMSQLEEETRDRSRPVPAPQRPRVIEPVSNAKNARHLMKHYKIVEQRKVDACAHPGTKRLTPVHRLTDRLIGVRMEDLRSSWFQEVMSDHHLLNLPSGHGTSYHLGVEGTTTLQV